MTTPDETALILLFKPKYADCSELNKEAYEKINRFISSNEVSEATRNFIKNLEQILEKQTPATPLKFSLPRIVLQKPPVPHKNEAKSAMTVPEKTEVSPPAAIFFLPNAKVGEPYSGKITGKDSAGRPIQVSDVKIDELSIGLSFDASNGEVRGTPTAAGEHKVALLWSPDGTTYYSGECLFIVNPDPRSLWKNLPPPADDPYFKANEDGKLIQAATFNIVAASCRGRSHEHVGSFRDDDFFIAHDDVSGWSLLICADGAGSGKQSRWGSKIAVETVGEYLKATLAGEVGLKMRQDLAGWETNVESASKSLYTQFYTLFQQSGKLAVQAIEAEAKAKERVVKEYATTLLISAVYRHHNETFLATFWMGDGAIAAYGPPGKVRMMGSPDSGEFAGQTRFLDRNALMDQGFGKRISVGRYVDLQAVILMTDGISDPRFETDNGLADPRRWDALWEELLPSLHSPAPEQQLIEWMRFWTPGHHDDRTIVLLW